MPSALRQLHRPPGGADWESELQSGLGRRCRDARHSYQARKERLHNDHAWLVAHGRIFTPPLSPPAGLEWPVASSAPRIYERQERAATGLLARVASAQGERDVQERTPPDITEAALGRDTADTAAEAELTAHFQQTAAAIAEAFEKAERIAAAP